MKKFITLLGFVMLSAPVFAGQISDGDIQDLLAVEDTLNGFCRG